MNQLSVGSNYCNCLPQVMSYEQAGGHLLCYHPALVEIRCFLSNKSLDGECSGFKESESIFWVHIEHFF